MVVTQGSGSDIINIDNDDDYGDDDEWDEDNIRKKYWNELINWISTSPTAEIIRFNVYHEILNTIKPKINTLFWSSTGDLSKKKILKHKSGYTKITLKWQLPMEGMAWDKILEEQRPVLAKSDMHKIFGEKGKIGSTALLFKGDVLELMVHLCCAFTSGNPYKWTPATYVNAFSTKLLKLAQNRFGDKILKWLTAKATRLLGVNVELSPSGPIYGNAQSYGNDLLLVFDRTFLMKL